MEKENKEAEERRMEEERKVALRLEQEKEEERLQDEKALKNVLKEQVAELKHRESEVNESKTSLRVTWSVTHSLLMKHLLSELF